MSKNVKELTELLSTVTTFGYRTAAGIGGLATFAYLRLINFFPSGMTPGEVLFFLFIAFAFAITYLLVIGYGAFSTLWLVKACTSFRNVVSFDDAALVSRLFSDQGAPETWRSVFRDRWHGVRMRATRARIDNLYAVPVSAQGWFLGLCSLFVFVYFVLSVIEFDSGPFTQLMFAMTFAGFVALFFASVRPESGSHASHRARFIGLALAPIIVLLFYAGPRPLLNMVFGGLGIYVPNVSLELPASELDVIERISEHIDRPLVDCHRPSPAMILVHGADILWTGVGDQTVIRFSAIDTTKRTIFSPAPELRQVQLKFDTKSLRIIKTAPRIDPCFNLSSDPLFKNSDAVLTAEGIRRLRSLVDTVKKFGKPVKIAVRAHSDARSNMAASSSAPISDQMLSQQRALAVAKSLGSLLNDKAVDIVSEGVGGREMRNKCEPDAKLSPYELNVCNKANRRVEVNVEYRK